MSGVFSAPEYFVFILTAQAEESERTRAVTPCVWAPFLQEMPWRLEFWHPMRLPLWGRCCQERLFTQEGSANFLFKKIYY